MRRILTIIIMLTFVLSGCATTKGNGSLRNELIQLQTRVCELEGELSEKNAEIERLNRELGKTHENETAYSDSSLSNVQTNQGEKEKSATKSPKNIQTALKNAGYYTGPIDGKMGPKTKKAIGEFQKANDLTSDGVVGKKTWSKLEEHLYSERSQI